MRYGFFFLSTVTLLFTGAFFNFGIHGAVAEVGTPDSEAVNVEIYFFGRDDCKYCKAEKEFLTDDFLKANDATLVYYNILEDTEAKKLFEQVTETKGVSKVTPVTVIGYSLIQGYDADETTGKKIIDAIALAKAHEPVSIEKFIASDKSTVVGTGLGCSADGESVECGLEAPEEFLFKLPFFGVVNLQLFSLFSLSAVLGFVDGFNPCAMWVLVTFLLILLQVGDRRKMWQIAGLFIVAEAVMYNLILNVWYRTWDFVGLDAIVTPLVGILALGGGVFFLSKYWRNRNKGLVCDVTDIEEQGRFEKKVSQIARAPLTLAAAFAVIGIAFSVNVIEFACSIGIPQAYTKILELNSLSFLAQQFYILVYTFFYMVDDFVVFGLALWGFNKLYMAGKYANLSALIGGILMLLLGTLLIFFPEALVF
jgi:glutaredoxin